MHIFLLPTSFLSSLTLFLLCRIIPFYPSPSLPHSFFLIFFSVIIPSFLLWPSFFFKLSIPSFFLLPPSFLSISPCSSTQPIHHLPFSPSHLPPPLPPVATTHTGTSTGSQSAPSRTGRLVSRGPGPLVMTPKRMSDDPADDPGKTSRAVRITTGLFLN